MKIAILSDIHGNFPALERVLIEADTAGVEYILVLGDMVGYYYQPEKVLEALEKYPATFIRGNHETMMLDSLSNPKLSAEIHTKYGSGINVACNKLSDAWLQKIRKLPDKALLVLDGIKIELAHGAPWASELYVYPDAKPAILKKCAESACDFIFMGHTHYPFVYCLNSSIVANVGSVGQARDKGGMASWGLVDTFNRTLVLKHTVYDTTSLKEEAKKIDPHLPYLHKILGR